MQVCEETIQESNWKNFLVYIKTKCSNIEYQNWFNPIKLIKETPEKITLEIPNVFVERYIISNYKKDLCEHLPCLSSGEPAIEFIINQQKKILITQQTIEKKQLKTCQFNKTYTFDNFIEGPSNQFVKSAALGVAANPGYSFNPLFIHGHVGLGKTHLIQGIGNFIKLHNKKLNVKFITTELFINEIVYNLRNKSLDKMKKFYRNVDVLLIDDIQFLQKRPNFEEEFCNTFEALINQNNQIVLTSDNPPSKLNLSERMIGRMQWGLVAHIAQPELETRIAIIQHKSSLKGLELNEDVALLIAENIKDNIRQIEGTLNKLNAFSRLMHTQINLEMAKKLLTDVVVSTTKKITVEKIISNVALTFEIKISEIKGISKLKNIAQARQVAMFLAKELLDDSLTHIASFFGGKTHSTIIHAWKKISSLIKINDQLSKQIDMIKKNL